MNLVEIFVPCRYPDGRDIPGEFFTRLTAQLTEKFNGTTAFLRSPAEGAWVNEQGHCDHDEIVIFEVLVEDLDRDWWSEFRLGLELELDQKKLLIRATTIECL